ncbi:AAEL013972-PA [Aedes aegypti]|uniref:AAEL013972-PA n=1 Tax=Aedes aegypti TaxID=7159 RepID=Q16HM4_AEDAE|nr:AAEL013972-PA [Aedes aegypti]
MAFEFSETENPVYKETYAGFKQQDCILVKPKDYSNVPITIPNWEPEPCYLNSRYRAMAQQIKEFEVRPDDVWLVTYPKSGTTWCQEMIWLICHNLDYEKAAAHKLGERWCYLEFGSKTDVPDPFKTITSAPSPRFIKSHLPASLLPDQIWTVRPKMVYVRRNPKSVAVSYFHHTVSMHGYSGTKEQFVRAFINDQVLNSPYHEHVIEFHHLNYPDNLLHLCFEDMKKDLKSTLHRVCEFFNKSFSDEQLQKLANHLSFDSLKDNKAVNFSGFTEKVLQQSNRTEKLADPNYKFMRRGEADGWKKELDPELAHELDEWTNRKATDPEDRKLFP